MLILEFEGGVVGNLERVLVLRPSKERESALRTLIRSGAEIVVADHPDNDYSGFADHQLLLPRVPAAFRENRVAEIEDRIIKFHSRWPLTALIADFDYLLPLVGRINDRLGLRGHTEYSGYTCSNKGRQRAALAEAGVPQPDWLVCTTPPQAVDFATRAGFPVVVKPTDRAASCAVSVVRDEAGLTTAVDAAITESWAGECLVESYLDGPEVSVEAVVQDGVVTTVAVTEKGIGGRTGVLKLDAVMPADLSRPERDAVTLVAAAAVLACGLRDGPAHTEVRLTAQGPQIVEVNGRIGGVFLSQMVHAVTGVDLYQTWIDVLHGRAPVLAVEKRGHAVRRCVWDVTGVIEEVEIGEIAVERLDHHVLTRCFVRPGDELAPIENGNEMRAAVVAFAPERDEAIKAADELLGNLRIRTSDSMRGPHE